MNVMIIVLCLVWYAVGFASFVYWWTKENDLKVEDLMIAFSVALMGPVTFAFGFFIHSDSKVMDIVLFKRKDN